MRSLVVFLCLQLADFITTFVVIKLGGDEGNPLVQQFIGALGVISGLVVAKTLIMVAATAMILAKKYRVVRVANIVFGGIVLWNATIIARLVLRGGGS